MMKWETTSRLFTAKYIRVYALMYGYIDYRERSAYIFIIIYEKKAFFFNK